VNTLKLIYQSFLQFLKPIWLVPEAIIEAGRQRKLEAMKLELENERLDRIRHPENYRGR
jgi:hypothetical protein